METRELTDMTAVLRSINDGNPSNAERWVTLTQRVVRAETRANAAERAAARKDWEKQNAEYDSWQSNYRAEVAQQEAAKAQDKAARWEVLALTMAAALVLRKGLTALLCAANGVSGQDGTASKTIFWFQRDSVRAAVVIPVREWLTNYLARAFGIPALALLAFASWAVVLWVLRHRGGNGRALFAAGLIVSQFSLGILQGTGAQMARAVQCFAVFVPFAAWLWLAPALDRGKQGGAKAIICAALAGAMLAVELISLTGTIRYNRDRWQYEERLLIKTADELNDLDPAGTLPVAFVGQAELSPELQDRLVIPAANPAYKAAYLIYTVLGGPLGDLDRYENPQTMVINWAQDAFGGKEQIALLMQQVGRPCALADADQQDAADTPAQAIR